MRFELITIFPEFFAGPLDYGILRRARESGIVEIHVQDLREFTRDRHKTVDDRPFGGGEGMVLKPEPLFEAVEKLLGHGVGDASGQVAPAPGAAVVLMSAAGKLFTVVVDAATRLIPGALGNEASTENESFREIAPGDVASPVERPLTRKARYLLDYPHYTRPSDFRGWKVPEVLIGGNHAEVAKWRYQQAEEKTRRNRPDLMPR